MEVVCRPQCPFAVTQHASSWEDHSASCVLPTCGPPGSSGWLRICGLTWLLLIGIYKRVTVAKWI